jgi:hypothetical protein
MPKVVMIIPTPGADGYSEGTVRGGRSRVA